MGGPGPELGDSEAGIIGSSGASVGNRMGRRQLPTAAHCSQMTGQHSTSRRTVLGFLSGLAHCLRSQHKRLKLLVPFSKPRCCGRGWCRRMLMKMKAGIQADVTSGSWQCGGNSGSVWIKRPYRACGPSPLGDSELHRQFWKCTAVGWYILHQCLNAAAVGGSLGDTARRCKGPCWVGGAGFPPSVFRHTHIPHLLGVEGWL